MEEIPDAKSSGLIFTACWEPSGEEMVQQEYYQCCTFWIRVKCPNAPPMRSGRVW
jgi:hypothetical protein